MYSVKEDIVQESSVRGSNTSVGPTEALPRKAYKGRVRAYTSGGFTLWSEWVTSNVCRSFPSPDDLPDMPGGIECTAITENRITFRWDSVLGTEGYRYGAVIRGTVDVDRLEATDGDDHPNPSAPASGVSLDLGVDRQYELWVWAYNDNGRSGTASVDCDTISDTWLKADCSGSGILKVRWEDPSGKQAVPSGYTGTITLASSLLDGLVASYDEPYDSANKSVEWGAIGASDTEYQVHVKSNNGNGGPVYSQTQTVTCPPLSPPDYNGPNIPKNLSWWQRGVILLGAAGGPPRTQLAQAASLLYFEGAEYALNRVSRTCNTALDADTGITTQTCDEIWNEYITVRLDETSFDETLATLVDAVVPEDSESLIEELVGRTMSLRLLWGNIKSLGAKKVAAKIAVRTGVGMLLETYVVWAFHEASAPYAEINGRDNCVFDQPKNRGKDIKNWTAVKANTIDSDDFGVVKSIRNSVVQYCKEAV